MRSALVIPSAFETFPYAQQILEEASFRESEGLIEFVEIMPTDKEIRTEISAWFRAFLGGGANLSFEQASTCVTVDSGAHRDDVLGDITLGAVLAGDHVLYTGARARGGQLGAGNVFCSVQQKTARGKTKRERRENQARFCNG